MSVSFMEPQAPETWSADEAEESAVVPEAELAAAKPSRGGLSGSVYDRIVQAIVYAMVLLVPLLYLPWTTGILEYNKQLFLLVLVSVGVVVWLLGIVVSGRLSVRTSPVDKGVLGVLGAVVLATIFSIDQGRSLFGLGFSLSDALLSIAALTVFYFLALNIARDRGRILRSALTMSLMLALLLGLLQMLAVYILPGSFTHTRAFTTVGSLNTLGILAAIALPLFAKMTVRTLGKATAWFSVVGVMLALIVLAILNWWVLWTVALTGMLAMIAFDSLNLTQLSEDYSRRRNRFSMSRFIIPMVVIVIGAFLFVVDFDLTSVRGNFPIEIGPSFGLSWEIVKGVFSERMLFGFGPENFSLAFDRFGAGGLAQTQLAGTKMYDATSHGITMLVQGGAFALLTLLLLFWCLIQVMARFGSAISESVAHGEHAGMTAQASGTMAATVAMTVALFLYPFNFTLLFVWYALLALSALIVTGDRQRTVDIEERPAWSLTTSLGFIVALILVLTGVYFTSVRYVADARYAKAISQETVEGAMEGVVAAINLQGTNDRYYRDASQLALLLFSNELTAEDDDPERPQRVQNLIASAVQLAQRATQLAPDESENWANLGRVYQSLAGFVQDVEPLAEEAFVQASELRPGDPTFDNEVGQMWLTRADFLATTSSGTAVQRQQQRTESLENAEAAFKRSIDKSPTFGLAIYNLGAVYDRQNRVIEAISQLEQLVPANPDSPTLMFELGLLYARDGRADNAIAAMQRAVLLAPQYANARWYLALLLEEQGDIQGALTHLQAVQEANEDNEDLQAKIEQLEAIPPITAEGEAIDTEPLQ